MDFAIMGAFGGAMCGAVYGEKVQNGTWEDHLHIRSTLAPFVANMLDRGILKIQQIPRSELALVLPGFGIVGTADMPDPFTGPGHRLYRTNISKEGQQRIDLVYHVIQEPGNKLRISYDHVPAFLALNGIHVPAADDVIGLVKARLANTMSLTECREIAQYSLLKNCISGRVDQVVDLRKLAPGDIAVQVKLSLDFNTYLADCHGFEEKLKSEIVRALGFAPDPCHPGFAEALQKHVKLEQVQRGSIWACVIIGGVVLVAAAFTAALYTGRRFQCHAGPAGVELGAHDGRSRQMRSVTMRGFPDGSFEIQGVDEVEEPQPNPAAHCAIL